MTRKTYLIIFINIFAMNLLANNPFYKEYNIENFGPDSTKSRLINETENNKIYSEITNNYIFYQFDRFAFLDHLLKESSIVDSISSCKHQLKINCTQKILRESINLAYSSNHLDDVSFLILKDAINFYKTFDQNRDVEDLEILQDKFKKMLPLDIKKYAQKRKLVSLKKPLLESIKAYPLSDKGFRTNKHTPRQFLYLRYSETQIKKLSEIVAKMNERFLSDSAYLSFGENDKIELSPEEKYRAAKKLLKITLNKEKSKGILAGTNPSYTDMLTAALETGDLPSELVSELTNHEEFKAAKKDYKKLLHFAYGIGKTVLLSTPGIGMYAILPIMVIEAVMQSKTQKDKNENSDHLF